MFQRSLLDLFANYAFSFDTKISEIINDSLLSAKMINDIYINKFN
jgi:hypothetical protein